MALTSFTLHLSRLFLPSWSCFTRTVWDDRMIAKWLTALEPRMQFHFSLGDQEWIISISPGFQFFAYFIASHLRLPSSILSSVNGFRVRWLSINVKSIWLPTKIMGHVQLKTLRIVICLQTSRGSKLAFGITNYCLQRHIEIEVEGNWDD